jgi:hypothetical protein
MPNLLPGKTGTKEAFGISKVHDDYSIVIPPKAIQHYKKEKGSGLEL